LDLERSSAPGRIAAVITAAALATGLAVIPGQAHAVGTVSGIYLKVHEKRPVKLVKVRRFSRVQRNKRIGRRMMIRFGWSSRHFRCLNRLWTRESGWRSRAHNGRSGARGIPQALPGYKMRSAGRDWRTNPRTQIRWGLRYIRYRYGSPCGAWGHSRATGWY
jgi:hypothetical protein